MDDRGYGGIWQVESPPEQRARRQESEGENGSRLVASPKEITGDRMKDADEKESQKKGDGCGKAVALECTAAVRGKSEDVGDASPG